MLILGAATLVAVVFSAQAKADYVDLVMNDPGLVSYWRFEGDIEPSGELKDENGNANPGIYPEDGGVTAGEGILGQGGVFDGEPFQVVEIENEENFDFEDSMSVEAWFKTDGFDKNWQALVNKGDDQWRLHRWSGEFGLAFGSDELGENRDTPDSGVEVDDNLWHQAVAVFDGLDSGLKLLYIDGELVAEQDITGPLDIDRGDTTDLPVMIGGNAQDNAHWRAWTGSIDEVSVYDRALSEDDVMAHFLAMTDPSPGLLGDFNLNGMLDSPDIDDLTARSAAGLNPTTYDLNDDSLVDSADVNVWIRDLFNSWVGDANLDGEFNTGDLVAVLASGAYEVDVDSVWSTGDFNGDGRSNSGDLVVALSDGGYEAGPRAGVAAVPEPASATLLLLGSLLLVRRRRR